jgi:hypothetical protein
VKFRYLHSAGEKRVLPVFMREIDSSSPRIVEVPSRQLIGQVRKETVMAGAVSQRLRLNLG